MAEPLSQDIAALQNELVQLGTRRTQLRIELANTSAQLRRLIPAASEVWSVARLAELSGMSRVGVYDVLGVARVAGAK